MILKEHFHSENLYNKMGLLSESQVGEIYKGIEWIINNHVDAVVVGGTAVIHYLKGGRDLTPDLDVLVPDLTKLRNMLISQGITPKLLSDGLGITVDKFNTDFLNVNAGTSCINKYLFSNKCYHAVLIGGNNLNIINAELLCIMKLSVGRQKDTDDAINLLGSGSLSKDVFLNYVQDLEMLRCIDKGDNLGMYSEMIK